MRIMQATKKVRYAVQALSDLADQGQGSVVTMSEIATRQVVSKTYMKHYQSDFERPVWSKHSEE